MWVKRWGGVDGGEGEGEGERVVMEGMVGGWMEGEGRGGEGREWVGNYGVWCWGMGGDGWEWMGVDGSGSGSERICHVWERSVHTVACGFWSLFD
jgi:hypothetical protein